MFEPGLIDGDTITTRRWRTMFHIIYISETDGVWARVPAFAGGIAVFLSWQQIAPEIRSKIVVDGRYHGQAAIGADSYEDLNAYIDN